MIEFKTKKYKCSVLGEESILPDLSYSKQKTTFKTTAKDFEGLFIGYGARETSYPYRQQNSYFDEILQDVNVAILENEYLYAEFLIDFGGRLWKLYDKKKKQDILYTNDVIRLRNLSVRNAWFSGGAEWNCGIIGHSPFTCKRMYCAEVKGKNGEEVLRFYEFERTRNIYYQMDFWLDKNCLYSRINIVNPNDEVVPMYWWSNIATPEYDGGRVAVNAQSAYNNSDGMGIKKSNIPFDDGVEVSYPKNIPNTIDYFYDISEMSNKFIANVDKNGYGLLQFSSNALKGRKLFSWGHCSGSANWQERLTDKAGWYVEIQAGLGKTQYECIPMPPKTQWGFVECYTLAEIDKKMLQADYADFVKAVDNQVCSICNSNELDKLCNDTYSTIALQKGEVKYYGSGYGYLYQKLGGECPSQLDFKLNNDIAMWLELFGEKKNSGAVDFAFGKQHKNALLSMQNQNDWRVFYQLALLAFDERDYIKAKDYTQKAFLYDNNLYLNHLYACILFCTDNENYKYYAEKTIKSASDNYSVCERIIKLLIDGKAYEQVINNFELCSENVKNQDRIKMYLSYAMLKIGNTTKAAALLFENGGLYIPDYREGEKFLDILYREIQHELTGVDMKDIVVPKQFDFIVAKRIESDV